jgi:hypothetical protein
MVPNIHDSAPLRAVKRGFLQVQTICADNGLGHIVAHFHIFVGELCTFVTSLAIMP